MKKYFYRLFQWVVKGIPTVKVSAGITNCVPNQVLANRHIIVTGGSSGIGFYIAQRFKSEGAQVVIVGKDAEKLIVAAQEIGCHYIQYDLKDTMGYGELIKNAADKMGGAVDGLVNNAAICNIDGGFVNVSEQSYDEQFLVNVKSPFFLTQAFVKYLESNNISSAGVIFITSERGLYPDDAPYGMTKAAVGNIIAGLGRRYAAKDIRFNGIAPGVTADVRQHPEKYDDLYLKGNIGKRFFLPQEMAEVATFLMSDASKCISGEVIPCDQANYYK